MKATFGHQTRAPAELINDNTVTLRIHESAAIQALHWLNFVNTQWPFVL